MHDLNRSVTTPFQIHRTPLDIHYSYLGAELDLLVSNKKTILLRLALCRAARCPAASQFVPSKQRNVNMQRNVPVPPTHPRPPPTLLVRRPPPHLIQVSIACDIWSEGEVALLASGVLGGAVLAG